MTKPPASAVDASGRAALEPGRAGEFGVRRARAARTPYAVVEALRLLVVVFFAGAGYQVGSSVTTDGTVLGALNGTAVGLVLGSGLGYVLGGVLGRRTASVAEGTGSRLRDVSAESLVAGALGGIGGVLLGAGMAWPVFFLPYPYLAFPLFGFIVVCLGYVGSQVAMSKRDGVLAMFGQHAGRAPRSTSPSALPQLLDTSVAIDGRLLDVVRAGFLHGQLLVPNPVLAELQGLADASDDLRRSRGRRGLEVLEALQREAGVTLEVLDVDVPGVHEVDAKLVRICLDRGTALLTLDTNLAKAASLAGVQVMNLHALAMAMRPAVAAGDDVPVRMLKAGKESGQAVGYLDDGSMVVVERARELLGELVQVHVTSVLTTANGRLVFGHPADDPPQAQVARPRRASSAGPSAGTSTGTSTSAGAPPAVGPARSLPAAAPQPGATVRSAPAAMTAAAPQGRPTPSAMPTRRRP